MADIITDQGVFVPPSDTVWDELKSFGAIDNVIGKMFATLTSDQLINVWNTPENLVRVAELFPGIQSLERLMDAAAQLKAIFPDRVNLSGVCIIDLGCGSIENPDSPQKDHPGYDPDFDYEPWFCRVAHILGASVIGVDKTDSPDEQYTHLQIDLTAPNALAVFLDARFDVVHMRGLCDSPQLLTSFKGNFDGYFAWAGYVKGEVVRILKPGGIDDTELDYWTGESGLDDVRFVFEAVEGKE